MQQILLLVRSLTLSGGDASIKTVTLADNTASIILGGSVNHTVTIGTALNPATNDGTLGLTGSATRTINATFGTGANSFKQVNLGGTGLNTFASGSGSNMLKL
jgi:hypothetical protein